MEDSLLKKISILIFVYLASLTSLVLGQGTRLGFYKTSCPIVEFIVQSAVLSAFQANPRVAPGLLRMFFHDCFVNGCDASILIDGPTSEKTAVPNVPLQGFEAIDAAKSRLEAICPGVVSCADILALAARDSVVLSGGIGWEVPTGRRDGLVSQASNVANLPAPNDPISVQIRKFADKQLNIQDLVTLVGGHTIGTASCATFSYRLYNFNNTNGPDPDINQALILPLLRALCPNGGDESTRVDLDTGSINRFDTSYFENLRNGRGVLESDAKLWSDPTTQRVVQQYVGFRGLPGLRFNIEFGRSMVKMGNTEITTGSQGQIRRICTAIN